MWCGDIGDQLICRYVSPPLLTCNIYANFLQDELPAYLGNVPLQTRWQMHYQHDGEPPHFIQVVRQYLNYKFPNRWIGRGGTQNWPPRSPDLNPLDYHVWGYMKAMVYAHKVSTTEKLLQRISGAARSIKTLQWFVQVPWSHESENASKQDTSNNLFWVLNGQSVTVHLTAQLNKCTMLLFSFLIYLLYFKNS